MQPAAKADTVMKDIDIDSLPQTLRDIADIIGMPAAWKLVQHLGGTEIYIPRSMTPGHSLCLVLGKRAANLIAEHYAGECVEVPRASHALIALRDAEIIRLSGSKTTNELARQFNLTPRRIRGIVAGRAHIPGNLSGYAD